MDKVLQLPNQMGKAPLRQDLDPMQQDLVKELLQRNPTARARRQLHPMAKAQLRPHPMVKVPLRPNPMVKAQLRPNPMVKVPLRQGLDPMDKGQQPVALLLHSMN